MKNAIILHGTCDEEEYYSMNYPSASNSHWIPWIQKVLLIHDIHAATPEMPHGYMSDYAVWKREFERCDITPETLLVGHSCGAGFLVRWLSENISQKVDRVVLVAPWLDPDHIKGEDNDFFDFVMDQDLVSRTGGVTIFASDDDHDAIHRSIADIQRHIKDIRMKNFTSMGHFCKNDMKTDPFPELSEALLQ